MPGEFAVDLPERRHSLPGGGVDVPPVDGEVGGDLHVGRYLPVQRAVLDPYPCQLLLVAIVAAEVHVLAIGRQPAAILVERPQTIPGGFLVTAYPAGVTEQDTVAGRYRFDDLVVG